MLADMWLFNLVMYFVVFFLGFKVGCRYSDFRDLMLARRVSALSKQAEKLSDYERDWDRAVSEGRPVMFKRKVRVKSDN